MIAARELLTHFAGKNVVNRPHLTAVLEPGTSAYVPVSASNMLPEAIDAHSSEWLPVGPVDMPQLPCRCSHPECRRDHA